MHQHPRPPPVSASPANSEQTNPIRSNNPRDRDPAGLRTTSPLTQGSGSSEDFTTTRQEQPADNPGAQMQRLNQVVQNFHTKAALIILHSRVELSPAYSKATDVKRVNRWFNLEIEETDDYKDDIKRWKQCDVQAGRPPPLVIEIFLTTESLRQGQRLVILDEDGKRWDVVSTLNSASRSSRRSQRSSQDVNEVILERWTIELGSSSAPFPPDLQAILPLVYKKSIVLFRALYTYANFLPAWKLSRKIGKSRSTVPLKLGYRLLDGSHLGSLSRFDSIGVPLYDSSSEVLKDYDFGSTESPAGPFSVKVQYRENCDFRIDDSEELLSSRFLGADDDLFRPSLSNEVQRDKTKADAAGSLPTDHRRNLLERPELGHAYGSLSTFHQAGIQTGTSPISALRNAQDYRANSPPTPEPARPVLHATVRQASQNSLRTTAANRRSSFSVQPFKAPTLSASPLAASPLASSPRTHSARIPTLGSLTEEGYMPPTSVPLAGRRTESLASENAVAYSASSSPKPAPVSKFSSSFSHRRARLSSGGTTVRTDDDQISSGKASATSSAQPGSGLMTEVPGQGSSGGSVAEDDDENISGFLKMLEQQKDLLVPTSKAVEANTRRTTAALNRFHKMRDSNTALSDSLSSSAMLQRSSASSSRQLSGAPPMAAGTSISTSSSPGKPISPHTPHTPFAPSRLSAAYSHDDDDGARRHAVEEEAQSASEAATEETAQAHSAAHVPAIDIPNSPRPFLPGYQRSSSAQRRPLTADDDLADLYGNRSASMGAHERRALTRESPQPDSVPQSETGLLTEPNVGPVSSSRPSSTSYRVSALAAANSAASDSSRSSIPYRASPRIARPGPAPQTSTSTLGTGASLDRGGDSSASTSWRGGQRRMSRPESRFEADEDLPFAMEKSDLDTLPGGKAETGVSER